MNIENTGSLTIHKLLNPNYREPGTVGDDDEFQGDGTATGNNANGGAAIGGQPLAGVGFTVVGRLTDAQVNALEDSNGHITQAEAEDFIANLPVGLEKHEGTTKADGTVTFPNLPVDTTELDNNRWLVVETSKPDTVDKAAAPVIVNVPTGTPETSLKNYNYDVNLYVKNYASGEPEIEKEIDKPTHSTGDRVQYTLKITDLPDDLASFNRLEVYDPLDERLSLLGDTPHAESLGTVTLKSKDGTVKKEFNSYITDDPSITAENTPAGNDVLIRTGKTSEAGKDQYIYWAFTAEGIAKLTDLEQGDYIELPFEVMVNEKANSNVAIPNDGELGFENKPGNNGTKPVDPEKPYTPGPEDPVYGPGKPTEVVNTIFGKKDFVKTDADTKAPLQGAEFIVKDTPKQPIKTVDADGNKVELPAGEEIYAVIENGRVVRWTADKNEATPVTSGADGKFTVDGLAYTNEVNYSKQYIFAVQGPLLTGDGSVYQPEKTVTQEYVYVAANPRTSTTTAADIEAEIQAILDAEGHENWVFYKESETNPAQIDFLGNQIHDYALEETKAPNGYVPLKNDVKFTVPGEQTGTDANGRPIYDNPAINVPNKKTPGMPITGGMGTIIFLVAGLLLMGGAYKLRKGKNA
ncbi:putative surface protein [Enterococcus sp. 5H]|nr:putative surface protein [Enterococcus sp. 5H]